MQDSLPPLFTAPGHQIQLRPIRLDDVDALLTWVNDPEVTRNFAGLSERITREQELAFLRGVIASDTDALFAIEHEGRIIGTAGLHKIYWPARNGRLGLIIGRREVQGRGLGQQALRLITALGFLELGLHKVWVVHYATNARMRHIVGKLGFVQEGVLRDEYFHRDAFHDMVRHSLLRPEFDARQQAWGLTGDAPP
jgi:RimJ/RimL family protein N-acetyltransferase